MVLADASPRPSAEGRSICQQSAIRLSGVQRRCFAPTARLNNIKDRTMSRFDPRNLLYVFLRRVHVPRWLYALGAHLLNQHFLLGAVAIIADEQGRLLLFHHTYRRRTPWGLPGGWMIRGESPLEAVVREVREESGLAI